MRVTPLILILAGLSALSAAPSSRSRSASVRMAGEIVESGLASRAVAVYPRDGGLEAHIRVRSRDGQWGEWTAVSREDAETGAFLFTESVHTAIMVDRPARVLFIDPGESAEPDVPVPAPGFVSRAEWGCSPDRCYFRGGSPSYSPVTHLIVHHTAGTNAATDWPAVMRSIWELHVNGNGWSDIGYNWLIAPDGVLYEGRQGGDGVIGAHFSGVNTNTMGVSLMGTFSSVAPPVRMMETLRFLLAWHASKWKLDPSGQSMHAPSQLRLNVIGGHRDAGLSPRASGSTECPGNGVYVLLPRIRPEVAAMLSESLPELRVPGSLCMPPEGGVIEIGSAGAVAADDWIKVSGSSVEVAANAGSARREATLRVGWRQILVTQGVTGPWPLPCVAARGVLTAGAAVPTPVVPGSLMSIYGSGLGREGGTTTAVVNGTRALTLLYAGPNQINALLPAGVPAGSARLTVTVDGRPGPDVLFWVTEAAPSLFAAVAVPGRAFEVYLTGAGRAEAAWSASIGGREAVRLFLGAVPGFPGLYQANVSVPDNLPAGEYPLTITVAGATSAPLTVWVP